MSSGFISEAEIEEKKRLRQEEWDKVRKPDDPLEAPEEKYDLRSLYERLQEQKQKKDIEYEEAHKLKNMIKGLDDDEVDFLDLVDRSKMEAERKKFAEEAQEMEDFRSAVASLQERNLQDRINQEMKKQPLVASSAGSSGSGSKSSQQRLLAGAVKRKSTSDATSAVPNKKAHADGTQEDKSVEVNGIDKGEKRKRSKDESEPATLSTMRCIGILPGMGHYHDSSDSDSSNTDEDFSTISPDFDLCGRKIKPFKSKSARMASDFFYPNVGGVEEHIYSLSQCLIARGHKVVVVTHAYGDTVGVRWLPKGLKVFYLPLRVFYNQCILPTMIATIPYIRHILVQERITLVHGHAAFSTLAHEAMNIARIMGLQVDFLVVGEGPKMADLKEIRQREGLHERIQLLGALELPDVREVLVRGHIFLNTSLTEAFCMAIVEAACCGLQVVSTNVGGIPEVLPPDLILLAEPDVASLTAALEGALKEVRDGTGLNPEQRHERICSLYNWRDVTRRTERVYNTVSRQKPKTFGLQLRHCLEHTGVYPFLLVLSLCYLIIKLFDWYRPRHLIDIAPDYPTVRRRSQSSL